MQFKLEQNLDVDKNSILRYINGYALPVNKIANKNLRKTAFLSKLNPGSLI